MLFTHEPPLTVYRLLPTRSMRGRSYTLAPSAGGSGAGDYEIEITQGKEVILYRVEEAECFGFAGRRFLWCKATDGEVYETHVGSDNLTRACSCTAGRVGRDLCKHCEVLFDAIHRGNLPPHSKDVKHGS